MSEALLKAVQGVGCSQMRDMVGGGGMGCGYTYGREGKE